MSSVSIIDYGMSNLLSISRAFEHLGARVNIISAAEDILKSDYLVLPGVGAFPDGMMELSKRDLIEPIREFSASGKPMMGICLGMQMLLSRGFEYSETKGLNLIEGEVLALPKDMEGYKVPNINWHSAEEPNAGNWEKTIFNHVEPGTCFYFVHSYYAKPTSDQNILATSQFGNLKFASAVKKDNISGTQFHPEKSGEEGLKLLLNFLKS